MECDSSILWLDCVSVAERKSAVTSKLTETPFLGISLVPRDSVSAFSVPAWQQTKGNSLRKSEAVLVLMPLGIFRYWPAPIVFSEFAYDANSLIGLVQAATLPSLVGWSGAILQQRFQRSIEKLQNRFRQIPPLVGP